jgi:uncharacterized membrane protein YtjA (UPF0391 family)
VAFCFPGDKLAFWHDDCTPMSSRKCVLAPLSGCQAANFERVELETIGKERCIMLSWALTFLVIALIAAALGFGGLAGTASYIAQVLFFVFLVLFIISLIVPRVRPPVA